MTPDDVTTKRFQATKFREGYDQDQVDEFLDRVVAALQARDTGQPVPMTADDVRAARFAATKFREGYDQDEVDDFLDEVETAFRQGATSDGAVSAAGRPAVPAPVPAAAPADFTASRRGSSSTDTDIPGLITPKRSWFGRRR